MSQQREGGMQQRGTSQKAIALPGSWVGWKDADAMMICACLDLIVQGFPGDSVPAVEESLTDVGLGILGGRGSAGASKSRPRGGSQSDGLRHPCRCAPASWWTLRQQQRPLSRERRRELEDSSPTPLCLQRRERLPPVRLPSCPPVPLPFSPQLPLLSFLFSSPLLFRSSTSSVNDLLNLYEV